MPSIGNLNDARLAALRMTLEVLEEAEHVREKRNVFAEVDEYITTKFYPLVNTPTAYQIMGEVQGIESRLVKIIAELVEVSKASEMVSSALEAWN